MSYIASNLIEGERLIYVTRYHWFIFVRYVFRAAMFAWLSLSLLSFSLLMLRPEPNFISRFPLETFLSPSLFLGSLVVGIALAIVPAAIAIYSSEFGVTNRRVVIKVGLIARHTLELNMSKIESFQVSESLMGRLLGFSNLTFIGSGGTQQTFRYVANGEELRDAVTRFSTTSDMPEADPRHPRRKPGSAPAYELPNERVSVDAQMKRAIELIGRGAPDQARAAVREIIQQDDQNADAWYLVGYLSEDIARKRAAYQRALAINPAHAKARSALQALR